MEIDIDDIINLLLNGFGAGDRDDESAEFYFDDEPIENVLYGKSVEGASPANLFLQDRRYLKKLETACMENRMGEIASAIFELEEGNIALSVNMCMRITDLMINVFPYYPNPIIKEDQSVLRPLFEKIWEIALNKGEEGLQMKGGPLLFRWYEHHGEYEKAKNVLNSLVALYRKQGNRSLEAIMLNNLAFEYMLEERWTEAIPIFEEAATIFKEEHISFEYKNTLTNYWICRFGLNDFGDIDETEAEIKRLAVFFKGVGRWNERKPLILLARIEECRGNYEEAIKLVEAAIESAKDSNTRYPEIDMKYLAQLIKKRTTCNKRDLLSV